MDQLDLTKFNNAKSPDFQVGAAMKRMEKLLLDSKKHSKNILYIFKMQLINLQFTIFCKV